MNRRVEQGNLKPGLAREEFKPRSILARETEAVAERGRVVASRA